MQTISEVFLPKKSIPGVKNTLKSSLELQVHTTNYNTNTLHRSISVIWHTWKLSCAYHTTTGHPVNAQQFLFYKVKRGFLLSWEFFTWHKNYVELNSTSRRLGPDQKQFFPCVSLSGEAAKKTKQWLAMDWKVRAFWEVGREVQNVTLFPTVRTFVRFFNKKIYEGA